MFIEDHFQFASDFQIHGGSWELHWVTEWLSVATKTNNILDQGLGCIKKKVESQNKTLSIQEDLTEYYKWIMKYMEKKFHYSCTLSDSESQKCWSGIIYVIKLIKYAHLRKHTKGQRIFRI